MNELRKNYGRYVVNDYDKHGHPRYKWVWNDFAGYLRELKRISPKDYGIALLYIERREFLSDRYWDVDGYREDAIRNYRNRLNRIRMDYGLSQKDVQPFKSVA